jgi:radical SAM protein with 4Fe4S-binding SPASM domain
MPYLKVTKTPLVRRTPVGTYLCISYRFQFETFSPILEIDESTEELFRLCDGTHTREDILQQLSKESGEPVEEIAEGFDEFVDSMIEEGVLEWVEEPSFIEPIYNRDRPFSITLDITSACNLHCPFCSADAGAPRPDDLTIDDFVPLIEFIKKYRITPLSMTGGEPLLKKEIVLYILEELSPVKEITTGVFTNGTLITKDYAQQLYDAGLRIARVSVDGHCKEVHDAIRGKGTFERTTQGIKYLRELGVDVSVASTISRMNYEFLREIRDFVSQIGDSFSVGFVHPFGRAAEDHLLNNEEILRVTMIDAGSERIQTNVSPRNRCCIGETLYINSRGDIFPCFLMQFPQFKVGNIREDDLRDIYKTSLMQEFLNFTVDTIEQCRDCDIRYFCGGLCRGSAHEVGGSLYVPDSRRCEPLKVLTQKILENGEENTRKLLRELLESTRKRGLL